MRLRLLREDATALRNLGANDDRPPLLPRDTDPLALTTSMMTGLRSGQNSARTRTLADLERHRANRTEGGVVGGSSTVAKSCRALPLYKAGIGEDLVAPLAMLVALVLDRRKRREWSRTSTHDSIV